MANRFLRQGTIVLALSAAVLPALGAAQTRATADLNSCEKPVWPREALRFEQQGTVTLAFLVGEDGAIQDAKVVRSSGFPLLDAAARDGIAKCRFKPAIRDGLPQAGWMQMQYVWTLEGGGTTERDQAFAAAAPDAKAAVMEAADRGEPQAVELLTRAAVRGNAAAQNWQGARYEAGKGVPPNPGVALVWYRKAAAAGDEQAKAALARLRGIPEAAAGQ